MFTNATAVTYRGVEFKSKHERAWARVWDRSGLSWRYEPTKFINGRQSYTPDFLILDTYEFYTEIKAFGARNMNRFELCIEPLFLIYGLPDRHYVRFKPKGCATFTPGHFTSWTLAYQKVFA